MQTSRCLSSSMRISHTCVRAADVQHFRRAGDDARGHGADVVGVDVESDGDFFRRIETQISGETAERFGQCDRGAAVQEPERLPRAFVDGHRAAQEIVADFNDADIERRNHRVAARRVDLFERSALLPDGHRAFSPVGRATITIPAASATMRHRVLHRHPANQWTPFRRRRRRKHPRCRAPRRPGAAVQLPVGRVRQLQGDADFRRMPLPAQPAERAECGRSGAPSGAVVPGLAADAISSSRRAKSPPSPTCRAARWR